MLGIAAVAAALPQPAASQVEAPGPRGALQGTLLPAEEEARALALIIPGSGPTDRDGNSPMGTGPAVYRLLAEALSARGVASVRIDKRGMFGSRAAIADANAVTIADYAADVRSWVLAVRARTGAPCVWLLGHSEGGLVALVARDTPGVCGLLLVAAPGRRLGETLREQLRSNPANAPLLNEALTAVARLETGQRVDVTGMHPALMPLFAPQVQPYLIDLLSHDPAALLRGYERPVLVLQGLSDLQVTEADARRLAAAVPQAHLVMLPGVNHVLKAVPANDRAANIAAYSNPDLPLASGVVDTIVRFLTAPARPAR